MFFLCRKANQSSAFLLAIHFMKHIIQYPITMKKLLTLALLSILSLPVFAQDTDTDAYEVSAIGFYNLENLFDTIDTPDVNDWDYHPESRLKWNTERYYAKQANMAKVIAQLGTELTPDGLAILGVSEIENESVLRDLVKEPLIRDRNYQIVHHDSPDERGIDCGLLYQPKYFTVISSKNLPVELVDPKTGKPDYTRDVLYVYGTFQGDPMHIMVNHWPSRGGGEKASAWRRAKAAEVCRSLADSIQAADPAAKIIVMGDLNDDPNNKSVTKILRGVPDATQIQDGELYNTMYDHYKKGNGTLAYRDTWNLFDQILISQPLVSKKYGGWQLYKSVVFRKPWMIQTEGAFRGYPHRTFVGDIFLNGYSDHLPVYIFLLKKKG